jgi:hypothetical protein
VRGEGWGVGTGGGEKREEIGKKICQTLINSLAGKTAGIHTVKNSGKSIPPFYSKSVGYHGREHMLRIIDILKCGLKNFNL